MSANDPRNNDSLWTRRSGVFIAALVIFALPGCGHQHQSHQAAQAPTTTATRASSTPQGTVKSLTNGACTLSPGPQAIPSNRPPQGTTWQSVDAMVVPQAPGTYGPQHTKDGFNVCFAHSPAGALLAAMNFYAAATTNPPKQVLKYLAIDVPQRIKDNSELDAGAGNVQLAGYKYRSYSSSAASITVVLAYPGNAYEAVLTNLQWVKNDWKVVYPTGGIAPHAQISSLAGYVQWQGM